MPDEMLEVQGSGRSLSTPAQYSIPAKPTQGSQVQQSKVVQPSNVIQLPVAEQQDGGQAIEQLAVQSATQPALQESLEVQGSPARYSIPTEAVQPSEGVRRPSAAVLPTAAVQLSEEVQHPSAVQLSEEVQHPSAAVQQGGGQVQRHSQPVQQSAVEGQQGERGQVQQYLQTKLQEMQALALLMQEAERQAQQESDAANSSICGQHVQQGESRWVRTAQECRRQLDVLAVHFAYTDELLHQIYATL